MAGEFPHLIDLDDQVRGRRTMSGSPKNYLSAGAIPESNLVHVPGIGVRARRAQEGVTDALLSARFSSGKCRNSKEDVYTKKGLSLAEPVNLKLAFLPFHADDSLVVVLVGNAKGLCVKRDHAAES